MSLPAIPTDNLPENDTLLQTQQDDLPPVTDEEFDEIMQEVFEEMDEELKDAFSDEAIDVAVEKDKEFLDAFEAAKPGAERIAVLKKYKRGIYQDNPDYDGPLFLT